MKIKGKLIVIEGVDGTGKETQTKLLENALCSEGLRVGRLSFPRYGTTACGPVEMYLHGDFGKKAEDVSPYAASVMYAVDRFASFKTEWETLYNNGGLLLCDRYTTSSAIFQGEKLPGEQRREYLSWLYDFEYRKMGIPAPDAVFYLNLQPEISARMLKERTGKDGVQHDIHETDFAYLRACHEVALDIAKQSGWILIAAGNENGEMRTREEVHLDILTAVHNFLKLG